MHDEEGRLQEGVTPVELGKHALKTLDEFLENVSHQRDSEPLQIGDQALTLGDLRDLSIALFGVLCAAKDPNTEHRWKNGVWSIVRESTKGRA